MFSKNQSTIATLAILFITLLNSQTLLAARALPEFKATYAVQKSGTKLAEAQYNLSHTDTGYKITQNTRLYGFAKLLASDTLSVFSLVDEADDHLLLTRFQYNQSGGKDEKFEDINIKWNTDSNKLSGVISGTVQGEKINTSIDGEIWDVLSFQIPLMIEASKSKQEYPYTAILEGEIKTYRFVLTASKSVSYANKEYQALQMVRTDPEKDRQLHIWVIPALHNIPVIVENYRDGDLHSRMQLESVQFNDDRPVKQAMEKSGAKISNDY